MPFQLTPGSAICLSTNAHRHGWNGAICREPSAWECKARQDFREDYCERGDRRCFHIDAFAKDDTGIVVEQSGGRWIFETDADAFDEQIVLLWGEPFAEPRGIQVAGKSIVYGGYRVKRVVPLELGYRTNYRVEPHADSWFRTSNLKIRLPFFRSTGGKYVKQIDRRSVLQLFDDLEDAAERATPDSWFDTGDRIRLRDFHKQLEGWLEIAAEKAERFAARERNFVPSNTVVHTSGPGETSTLSRIRDVVTDVPAERPVKPVEASVAEPLPVAEVARPELIELTQQDWIQATYGNATLQALRTASLTKPLVILRGDPGVGKSHLAVRLLEDEERERTCILPVVATWRGREDLLGYVNPVTGFFEATEFTRFLVRAEAAQASGDERTWLVVFEEFNLSQPEHWLADVLAVSQFENPLDRRLVLGGKGIEDLDGRTVVTLSPNLSFLATINTDHTTRPLSPRVLDRSAIVHLTMEPRDALRTIGITLDDDQVRAIETLHALIHSKGAGFSVRTAKSMRACLARRESLGLDDWGVLDVVLAQEVLSKLRLHARDPIDEELIETLNDWSQNEGSRLTQCPLLVEQWKERLNKGQDVIQA